MKPLSLIRKTLVTASCLLGMSFMIWQPDFETAKKLAKEKHQLILLNFSGSDWCGPCIRMHREIFGNENFMKMADSSLEMVNADFPRMKKNQLPAATVKQNEALADKYNPNGKFPFTLLLDAAGNVIKTWDGVPEESATAFAKTIRQYCESYKQ